MATAEPILSVYCDGGARGNPGPAAFGFIVQDRQGRVLARGKARIGEATNNLAEYSAVLAALTWLARSFAGEKGWVRFHLDSLLVVSQLNGRYKIKNHRLRECIVQVRGLEQELRHDKQLEIEYTFIPRDRNREDDFLVNQALDAPTSTG